jgi:hypothetical protein
MAGCDCPDRRLEPVASQDALVFPWAGVAVMPHDYETYGAIVGGEGGHDAEIHAFHHAAVRFLQALGSSFLIDHGLRLGIAAQETVGALSDADGAFARESARLSQPEANGLSCLDLLESAAELEAVRLGGLAGAYRDWLDQVRPDPASPQRRAFDWLAARLGDDAAGELLAPLTFLAFVGSDPCAAFAWLADGVAPQAHEWSRLGAGQMLEHLEWRDGLDGMWDLVAAGEPVGSPYITDAVRVALSRIDRGFLIELLARPATYLKVLPEQQLRSILPPLIVYPAREGGVVLHRNGVALDVDPTYAGNALAEVGLHGAAQRLTGSGPDETYCNHTGCPVHRTALCHAWYAPPTVADGHDACGFVTAFAHHAGTDPASAWERV